MPGHALRLLAAAPRRRLRTCAAVASREHRPNPEHASAPGTTTRARPETRVATELARAAALTGSLTGALANVAPKYESSVRERVSAEAILAGAGGGLERLEDELRAEMSAMLGRADRALREKISALELVDRKLAAALEADAPRSRVRVLVEEFNAAHERATEARTALIIQREAAGFHVGNYALVTSLYPLPLRRRMREDEDGESRPAPPPQQPIRYHPDFHFMYHALEQRQRALAGESAGDKRRS